MRVLLQDQENLDPVFRSDFRTWKPERRLHSNTMNSCAGQGHLGARRGKDPSIQKCAEVVGHTTAVTQAFAAEIARLSDLSAKLQPEISVAIQHQETAPSDLDRQKWGSRQSSLESTVSENLGALINAVNGQDDYVSRLGQFCADRQQ